MTTEELIEALIDHQARCCAYATREGDGRTCDCKFRNMTQPSNSEATGCPELRRAIWELQGTPWGTEYRSLDEIRLRGLREDMAQSQASVKAHIGRINEIEAEIEKTERRMAMQAARDE